MPVEKVKLRAGNLMIPVELERTDDRIFFNFGYNKSLMEEIKTAFEQRKFHGYDDVNPRKVWSAPITQRNMFQLDYLRGAKPYAPFDLPLDDAIKDVKEYCRKYERPCYSHQFELIAHGLVRHFFLWAAEMGTGKTLAAIVLMEMSGRDDWIWVGPKSALRAVQAEMRKWKSQIIPTFYTYEGLKKVIKEWRPGEPAPHGVIADESARVKTPTAQRSIALKHIADSMRDEYGRDAFVGLLSGAPAPKSPVDYWMQCEIACPGFLRERDIFTFRNRLGIIEQKEQVSGGGVYPSLVTWRDDESKCNQCGQVKEHPNHTFSFDNPESVHTFIPSVNEVAKLYKRMKGLVIVKMKKDCLDLPEKIYELITLQPSREIQRTAELIVASSRRAIEALTRLRELSDGFQYQETQNGEEPCPLCNGSKKCVEWYDPEFPEYAADPQDVQDGVRITYDDEGFVASRTPIKYSQREVECTRCSGKGVVPHMIRTVVEVPCPKDEALLEQLDLHDDVGRLNVYAGFTGSIDRISALCRKANWGIIRVDGRGWFGLSHEGSPLPDDKLLDIYDRGQNDFPRLVFIGQPGSAGMGLTLTASPTTLFYSNDFNGDSRIQAEDRGHRIGMDRERGGRIIDLIHLPSDQYVLDNLKKKKDLLSMSMTGLTNLFKGNVI